MKSIEKPTPAEIAERYTPGKDLFVTSKTIGTDFSYKLDTGNISRSGMLLNWRGERNLPFIENTIIEMVIDPNGEFLTKPVACMGKIVRKAPGASAGAKTQYGVSIVQVDEEDQQEWDKCLKDLAASGVETRSASQLEEKAS